MKPVDFPSRTAMFGDGDDERGGSRPSGASSGKPGDAGAGSSPSLGEGAPDDFSVKYTDEELAFLSIVRQGERDGTVEAGTAFRLQMNPPLLRAAMADYQKKRLRKTVESTATVAVAKSIQAAEGPGLTIKGKRFTLKKPPDILITIVTWVTVATVGYQLFRLGRGLWAKRSRRGGKRRR